MQLQRSAFFSIPVAIVALLFFVPFLGAVHLFDWDEINFAESAREMLVTGNFSRVQINYEPFWEKPPFFFWLQAIAMQVFGENEFAARLPNAVTGVITLVTFFLLGSKLKNERFGLLWAAAMLGSFLPHLYFKSGIIDPVFNYFIFLGIWFAAQLADRRLNKFALLSGFFIGLATITKGPVALLIMILTVLVYWISTRFRPVVHVRHLLLFILSYALTAGIWFMIDVMENGIGFLGQFIRYQLDLFLKPVAGHGQPFYYHFVVVLLGCFPISVMALPALMSRKREPQGQSFGTWMLIVFWVVMILFSIVRTKIVHYSSLAYFPLSFLAARYAFDHIDQRKPFPRWQTWLLLFFGFLFSLVLAAAPWLAKNSDVLVPYLKDPFAVDCLKTEVAWSGLEPLIGIAYAAAVMIAAWLILRSALLKGFYLLFLSTALCLLIYLKAVVPRIEQYSQGPAIEFYESLQGKGVYVTTFGFKSYAQYFYFRVQPGSNPQSGSNEWLLHGDIDKPAYFVAKTTSMQDISRVPGIRFLYQKGGFAFYIREMGTQ
jgi:4-amino-4-deoxy-L-arabinose transferase-like glycosyltransferase